MLCVLRSAKLALDCVFSLLWPFSGNCFVFPWIFFSWKYRHREMIFYIAIYKCVQRRKYIIGFSQRGSMHELFFEDGRGVWGTLFVNARFPNRIKPYRLMLNICAVCVLLFFVVCLFVCFPGYFWFLLVLSSVCRENIGGNLKRHWLMQHASRLTAVAFSSPLWGLFCLLVCFV